ncbi:Eukaryotic initiation factor 4F subunit [Dirofilaria immitis]
MTFEVIFAEQNYALYYYVKKHIIDTTSRIFPFLSFASYQTRMSFRTYFQKFQSLECLDAKFKILEIFLFISDIYREIALLYLIINYSDFRESDKKGNGPAVIRISLKTYAPQFLYNRIHCCFQRFSHHLKGQLLITKVKRTI